MDKFKIKKILFLILILYGICVNVRAAGDAFVDDSTNFGGCGAGVEWCYSSMGIRISLYENEGTKFYRGSIDFSAYDYRLLAGNAYYATAQGGRVAYKNGDKTLPNVSSWSKGSIPSILTSSKNFPGYNNLLHSSPGDLKAEIIDFFGLDTSDATVITNRLGAYFNVNNIELTKTYITVEPTMIIYKSSDKNNKRYYGTIYELAQITSSIGMTSGFTMLLEHYNSIRAENPSASHVDNSFLSKKASDNPYILITTGAIPTGNAQNKVNAQKDSNKGYGIGVFWLGDYVDDPDCERDCGRNLDCSINWCVTNEGTTTPSAKEDCAVNICKVSLASPITCGSNNCGSSKNEECPDSTPFKAKVCKSLVNDYLTLTCEEEANIIPSNDLPVTLHNGTGGFNYSVNVMGKRSCTLKYNSTLYEQKKKFGYSDSSLGNAKSKFNSFSWNDYGYSNDYKLTLKVSNKEYDNSLLQKVAGTDKTTTMTQTSASSTEKKASNSGSVIYALSQLCYSIKTGKFTKVSILSGCSDTSGKYSDAGNQYYGFYLQQDKTLTTGNVETKLQISKDVKIGTTTVKTCNDDTNKCNFDITDKNPQDSMCYTTHTPLQYVSWLGKYKTTVTYKASILKNELLSPTCLFVGIPVLGCGSFSTDVYLDKNETKVIKGQISYLRDGELITNYCNTTITAPGTTTTGASCPALYKPSEYDSIRNYCNSNWQTDTNNYYSATDCYNKCSRMDNRSCKSNVKCNNETAVKNWCSNESNRIAAGYKSKEACLNDCSCPASSFEFIYRPIATGKNASGYNAFPDRDAGSNWVGYEVLTEKTEEQIYADSGNKAQYVIELDSSTIQQIKNNTASNKFNYINYSGSDINGYFKSTFVNGNSNIFVCIKGSGNCSKEG